MSNSPSNNLVDGLPIPAKEKVARWAFWGGVVAVVTTAVNVFMPFINKGLTLLLNGMFTFAQLGMLGAAICFGGFALIQFWPVFKRFIESCANRATWALFEYDPITPMVLWLAEVRKDRQTVEKEYMNVDGVISNSERMIADALNKAKKGDALFATAVSEKGSDSSEARLAALEPSRQRQTAENIQQKLEGLKIAREILSQVVDATVYTERAAEVDVDGLRQEWETSKTIESATDSAYRAIVGRSERKQNAQMSMKIIRDKYATQFGRLRGLQRLSRELISGIDLEKGTFHREALDRLRAESQLITGNVVQIQQPALLEAQKIGQLSEVSFYKVPEKIYAEK